MVLVMACCLNGTKPLPEPILTYHQLSPMVFSWGKPVSLEMLKISIIRICYKITHIVPPYPLGDNDLTHWGRVTHICVSKLAIIGPDNGLAPSNAGILLIEPLGTNVSEILIGIQTFLFKKLHYKMSSAKWCPLCLGLNVLRHVYRKCTYW